MEDRQERGKLEQMVRNYLMLYPDIYSSLRSGIVNISSLARDIHDKFPEYSISSIRYTLNKISSETAEKGTSRGYLEELLGRSKITLQDKIAVVTTSRPINVKYLSATYLQDSIVYIVDELRVGKIEVGTSGQVERDVSAIHILSPKEIERVPGFVMRITERLFSAGINILQLISCSNETIIVVRRSDGIRAYEALTL
ncbi:hypothetical protein GCM10007108_12150 [Thermogymnomonas acidicola]|uniref:CASTOR ACT domain-containing protein n=2 Tax=Thermogymnomonas acidicola TaxID=399579 RepID=A0AA37F9N3_9ARCH|nr:ACT domain-containing protein [Thermogymnomonas acidicola]GGM75817.1 hypothetical protein GCM10007108_12150 [Thermogymnomonas acidicola]